MGRATFQNSKHRLWPGELLFLTIQLELQRGVLAVPTAAIQTGQQGTYVYVVDAKNDPQTRPITIAQQVDSLTVVPRGVVLGERVVVDGQSRIRPGATVSVIGPSGDTATARSAAGSVDTPTGEEQAAMNVSERFIRRPVMTILVMTAILLFGFIAYRRLPISDLPTVDYPTITVSASLPGASPATMASAVATPLEKQFSTIAGIDNMTSTSSLGSTTITLQFSLSRDIDAAAQDVQAAIAQTLRSLPIGIMPPSYQKSNPAASPIQIFALTSPTLSISALDEIGETLISQRLSMIDGVAQVQVFGAAKYAVRAQLDPMALAYRQIGIDEVATAINNENVNQPTGVLWGPTTAYTRPDERPTERRRRVPRDDRHVPQRRGGALGALGRVLDDIQNNKSGELVQRHARDHSRHSAPAEHEHGRRREGGERELDSLRATDPGRRERHDAVRPLARHRTVGARREDDAASSRCAW